MPANRGVTRRQALKATAGIATAGIAGCMGGGGSDGAFTIGLNLELSAGWEPYGLTQQRAVEIAVDEMNDDGGLDGREVEMVVEDNQVDPQTTRDMTDRLVQEEGADILLGPISSATRVAMSARLGRHEVPAIYATQYEGQVAEDYCNEWLFKTGEIPPQQIDPFIPWLIDEYGGRFYLLGDDYLWPRTMNELIRGNVEDLGGEVVGEEYVALDATDFSSIIPRIEQSDPDVLFMELTGAGPPAIQQQMQEQGVRGQWAEVGLAHGQGVLQGAPPDAVEGLLTCHAYMENLDNSANNEFVSEFRDRYGEDAPMTYLTGPMYVAAKLIQEAVAQAGGTSTEDLRNGLNDASIDTIVGEVAFEVDQQASVGTTVGEANSNLKFDPVTNFDPVTPDDTCDDI